MGSSLSSILSNIFKTKILLFLKTGTDNSKDVRVKFGYMVYVLIYYFNNDSISLSIKGYIKNEEISQEILHLNTVFASI